MTRTLPQPPGHLVNELIDDQIATDTLRSARNIAESVNRRLQRDGFCRAVGVADVRARF